MSVCVEIPGNSNFAGNYGSKNKPKWERVIQGYSTFRFFMEAPNNRLLPETDVSNESH